MEKKTITKFGKEYYLLGINNSDEEVWLEEPSFNCNWYWGLGYVEVFNNNKTDIIDHSYFDSLFLNKPLPENFLDSFKESTLSKDEIWKLLELMKSCYIARHYSDMLHIGGANITNSDCSDIIKSQDEYDRINKVILPALFKEIKDILTK